jgi:hypothetical protein
MKRQIEGVNRDLKGLRREAMLKEKTVIGLTPAGWMRREVREVMKKECEKSWTENKRKMEESVWRTERKVRGEKESEILGELKVGDKALDEAGFQKLSEEQKDEPIVEGVELNEDEKEFIILPKGMADNQKFDRMRMLTDIAVMEAKARFSLKNGEGIIEDGDVKNRETIEEKAERDEKENREAEAVRVREEKKVRFAKKRVTSLKTCRRITIPGALKSNVVEIRLKALVGKLEQAVEREEEMRKRERQC